MKMKRGNQRILLDIKHEDHGLSGVKTAGFWSANVLWNKPTLQASVADINKTYKHINVKMNSLYSEINLNTNI